MVASEALARLRPDWAFERLDGIGHLPQLEAPDRFAAVVERWLERRRLAWRPARPV
jgi:pimeloyl-ACP methyl ester carboxylesterase